MNDNTALFIFDFDGTLVNGHSHNYIGERLGYRIYQALSAKTFVSTNQHDQEILRVTEKYSVELMEAFLANDNLGWKNEKQLVRLFKNIILSGHKIAIASFNDYPNAVKYALEELLGEEDAAKVYIKSGLPAYKAEEIKNCTKKSYIKEIMRNIGITNKKNVFFMDDDKKHTDAAIEEDLDIQGLLIDKKLSLELG